KTDRNRLLRRSGAMLAFPDVVYLLAHEFARLRRRGFSGALVSTSSFHRRLLGHMQFSVRGASRKLDAISIRVVRSFQLRAGLNHRFMTCEARALLRTSGRHFFRGNLWPSSRAT